MLELLIEKISDISAVLSKVLPSTYSDIIVFTSDSSLSSPYNSNV